MNNLSIDFSDYSQLVSLMDEYESYPTSLLGENENGELVITSILEDCVVSETQQSNGWVRKMYYHRDGEIEETYDGKWDDGTPDDYYLENKDLFKFAEFCKSHNRNVDHLLKEFLQQA